MMVVVKDRLHALKNPYAHLHLPDISIQMVEELIMLWDPLHYLGVVPVLGRRGRHGHRFGEGRRGVDGVDRAATRLDPRHGDALGAHDVRRPSLNQVNPQAGRDCAADLYKQAGITNPREDFDMAEVYVPFSWYEPMPALRTSGSAPRARAGSSPRPVRRR